MKYGVFFKNYEGINEFVEERFGEDIVFEDREDCIDWILDHEDELGEDEEYIIQEM